MPKKQRLIKIFVWPSIWLTLLWFAYLGIPKTDTYKNIVGHCKQYESCPNCTDSFYWKEYGFLFSVTATGYHKVNLCNECLQDIPKLDADKIEQRLLFQNYSERKALLAKITVLLNQLPPPPDSQ